ncbi:hypothetical protein CABS01_11222 [Colletotrichum abscissum]|uniref:Transmembrane protein n=2 Tax=Colletotrichum acutatum species complex TaxID=2707335 RepID=A0A9P9XA59_9PEZI|nr:uncharacterized protein CCOS01_12643 [Colletotrichum costaricense]XP_060397825.1 uncharacterized protein CABS01_11222 [Colletotrichum abscissum]KAI3545248.1 hypothetical protein CABS02_09368 [Colletotrichum abscissum]KAK1494994.1 hypothetical protein CABS01_11222 [Colletotrichum abscissum]KAK1517094.1 hypothetical protein CCOS01_12643 [Colletotrichum costaricense]
MHTSPTPISLQPRETPLPVAARQEETGFHVITQTIYRPSSTFVTYVTLGSGPPTSYSDGNPADPPAAAPTTDPPPPDRSSGSLSSAQIGGILGGIVAFVAIVLIAWFCISQNKRRPGPPPDWDSLYYDSSSESGVTGSRGPRTPRIPPRVYPTRGRPMQYVPMPQPQPPEPFHINRYDAWKVKTNGPARRQQPPPPQRYRTRVF